MKNSKSQRLSKMQAIRITDIKLLIAQQHVFNKELSDAIEAEYLILMEDLLQKGANPNQKMLSKYDSNTYLLHILNNPWFNKEEWITAIQLLLTYHANLNFRIPEEGSLLLELEDYYLTLFKETDFNLDKLKQSFVPIRVLLEQDTLPIFRFGMHNPESIEDNIYFYIITNHATPYPLRERFKVISLEEESYFKRLEKCVWHYDRFGTSKTILPDDSILFIGGEHEDFYDSDHCVFNDVLKIHPLGKMELFFYPPTIFPPTNFHTATYYAPCNSIIIIGNLSYGENCNIFETSVYQLDLVSFSIHKIKDAGNKPNALQRHEAFEYQGEIIIHDGIYFDDKKYVKNENIYSFNPKTNIWTLLQ